MDTPRLLVCLLSGPAILSEVSSNLMLSTMVLCSANGD